MHSSPSTKINGVKVGDCSEAETQGDPSLNHPAVKLARDALRFCPNLYWRQAIIVTAEQDMNLWKDVIRTWATPYYDKKGKRKFRNPLDWKHMISEFERRWFDSNQKAGMPNGNGHI